MQTNVETEQWQGPRLSKLVKGKKRTLYGFSGRRLQVRAGRLAGNDQEIRRIFLATRVWDEGV